MYYQQQRRQASINSLMILVKLKYWSQHPFTFIKLCSTTETIRSSNRIRFCHNNYLFLQHHMKRRTFCFQFCPKILLVLSVQEKVWGLIIEWKDYQNSPGRSCPSQEQQSHWQGQKKPFHCTRPLSPWWQKSQHPIKTKLKFTGHSALNYTEIRLKL